MRISLIVTSFLLLTSCFRLTNHIPFIGDNSAETSSSKEKISHKEKRSQKHSKKNKNALILKKSFPLPEKKPTNDMEVPEQMSDYDVESGKKWFWEDKRFHHCDREKN